MLIIMLNLSAINRYQILHNQNTMFFIGLIAKDISSNLPINKGNIFISFTPAYSDGVYDHGSVINWDYS